MSGAAFTPGPWFRSGVRQKVGGSDTHSIVATVDGKEIIIASVWYSPLTHEGFHDAGLIAAAPDLIAALIAILHTYDDGGAPLGEAFQMANAAISKAHGAGVGAHDAPAQGYSGRNSK